MVTKTEIHGTPLQWALIRCDINCSCLGDVLSRHRSENAALRAGAKFSGTTGAIGLYVAQRKDDGNWERHLEARDRLERPAQPSPLLASTFCTA